MRQKNETATSFNQLKEITQAIQAQKKRSALTSDNANISEITSQSTLTPKARTKAKNHALKPTKKAFSERQNTAFRDKSQASANKSQENKQGDNANAFKSDEAQGLATQQPKGGNNEA
ncbi:hypothetical protein RGC32_05760 [Helicobacter pylori]|uniref:hypothetical protein n=1 Tax=Helicobacter pylori TaxID=210 RepID=UPI002927CC9D|nr:hypothetical protein [Helicobacter pylori]MDU9811344.1 hypothetical protein [Helicobacter pylori]